MDKKQTNTKISFIKRIVGQCVLISQTAELPNSLAFLLNTKELFSLVSLKWRMKTKLGYESSGRS